MTDYTASINAKGCDKTGITEELAAKLYNGGINKLLAIVELSPSVEHNNRGTGKKKIDLTIDSIEPVIGGNIQDALNEHVRNIQATLYRNRMVSESGEQLPFGEEDGPAPRPADLIRDGRALLEDDDEQPAAGDLDDALDQTDPGPDAEPGEDDPETDTADGAQPPTDHDADPFADDEPQTAVDEDPDHDDSNVFRPAFSG